MAVDQDFLEFMESLERIDDRKERRRQLMHFVDGHLSKEAISELANIDDPDRLYEKVYDVFTRGWTK